jgi:hypothetical protein
VKVQWILLALLFVVAAGLAVSWGLGFWDEPAAPVAMPPPQPPAKSASKEPPPLDTAAWMLAHSQPAQPASAQPVRVDDDSACGVSRAQCPDDSTCIDGACLHTVCVADGGGDDGRGVACALPAHKAGSCCGERCVDLAADSASCGRCGIACDRGLDCVTGHCEARSCAKQMAATSCLASEGGRGACCRGECVDQTTWMRDAANCGGCGHACAPGLACEHGACTDPATGAPPAWNCFERGHTCPEESFCVIDACYPKACGGESDGMLCPGSADGQIGHCCDQVCTDLFTDSNNCRACGVRCNSGEVCKNGECRAQ